MKFKLLILAAVMSLTSVAAYAENADSSSLSAEAFQSLDKLEYEQQQAIYSKAVDDISRSYILDIEYDTEGREYDLPGNVNYPDRHPAVSLSPKSETERSQSWEEPMAYFDFHAFLMNNYNVGRKAVNISLDGKAVEVNSVVCNDRTLIPGKFFEDLGCEVSFDEEYYMLSIAKGDLNFDFVPHMLAMRKNKAEGYYISLNVCPRWIDGEVWVPVRDVCFEFDINVEWDGNTNTVVLTSKRDV